jgi:hypothetical protein
MSNGDTGDQECGCVDVDVDVAVAVGVGAEIKSVHFQGRMVRG